ncbi:MAG: hypothetical protein ABW023_02205 [Sphingomonas sp.]
MRRGARFLGSGQCAVDGRFRAKVIGNGLRELDRFLNVLIGELARSCGVTLTRGQDNTANKLHSLRRAMGTLDPDHARLRAFGRTRECLFHCAGMVGRGDARDGAMLTTGWREPRGLRRVAVGTELIVSAGDIADACDYYEALASQLLVEGALYLAARMQEPRATRGRIGIGERQWFAA